MKNKKTNYLSLASLLPLIVFISIFLGSGLITGDFYALPSSVAVICGIVTAFILFSYNRSINQNIQLFIRGCGKPNILIMCIITLLSGVFAVMSIEIGAINTFVQIAEVYLSPKFLYAGIFILASFLSFSSGTSTGTISTLAPIGAGFIAIPEINAALIVASLLGGAMFGDNLSFVSDTTIAATQSQGCKMKDKFRVNVKIAVPASIITILILIMVGINLHSSSTVFYTETPSIDWIKILPYLVVILLATIGVNVLVTLFIGILTIGGIAFYENSMNLMDFAQNFQKGFSAMNDIFLVFLFMGGLSYMIEKQGGIRFLTKCMQQFMTSPFKAKAGIALLVGIIDAIIANNTIAIIVTAPIAKNISQKFNISPSHTASILDISSCIVQGIIPYGMQILLLFELMNAQFSYIEVVSQSYYIWLLLIFSIIYFSIISKKVQKN